jgi:hypothetical protein
MTDSPPSGTVSPTTTPTPPKAVFGRATFDLGSFVAGIVFMAIGLAFILEADGRWAFQLDHFRYIGPLVLIVIGISIVAGAGLGRRHD